MAYMHFTSGSPIPRSFTVNPVLTERGLAAVLYLFFQEKQPLTKALDHLTFKYGHVKQGKTGVIDAAFAEYLTYAQATGAALDDVEAFFQWVDTHYDPQTTKAAFRSGTWGNILTELLWQRE